MRIFFQYPSLFIILCLLSKASLAQQPTLEWAQRFDNKGPTSETQEEGNMIIAVDESGNSYVTGMSSNENIGVSNIVTVKYSPTGAELWATTYEEGLYSMVRAITVDNAGGVYVLGTVQTGVSTFDYVTVRYDAFTGEQTWNSWYDGGNNSYDDARAIAVDKSGGIYVTGSSDGGESGLDYATVRYEAATGEQTWASRYDGPAAFFDDARAIAVDNAGGVYVTGSSDGGASYNDYATVRYESATGKQTWASRYDSGNFDQAVAIAVDDAGGVYITGYNYGWGYYNEYNYATVRYQSATGNQSWASQYGEGNLAYDEAKAIAIDNAGGIYITGYSYDRTTIYDFATIRYNAATGVETWVSRYNGIGSTEDYTMDIATDAFGNSYVTGTSENQGTGRANLIVVKYSPSGEQLWEQEYSDSRSAAITLDSTGGVYVIGTYFGIDGFSYFVTLRYDAATGVQTWESLYDADTSSYNLVRAIAVDNAGGVYVTGYSDGGASGADYATVRYEAATGKQSWASRYDGGNNSYDEARAVAVDRAGGVYVTGTTSTQNGSTNYATVRYEAATGIQSWASSYSPFNNSYSGATAIITDNVGGVYVTGYSDGGASGADYATVRYEAATGKQSWASRYDGGNNSYDEARAVAVDQAGDVYVTGTSDGKGSGLDYATVRYNAVTGKQIWASRYNGAAYITHDQANAIAVDNKGIYVTGMSYGGDINTYSTVKYNILDGSPLWEVQTVGPYDTAVDLALDMSGNVFVTGYSYSTGTGFDFLTLKYIQQEQCLDLAEAAITGYTTVSSGFDGALYALSAPGASTFYWSIIAPDGSPYTAFTGQGTSTISVDWPASSEAYKISVSYAANEGCPSTTSFKYVYVYDPQAGFVTGGGWSDSPANPDYELMQQEGRAYWAFGARYKESRPGGDAGDPVQGALLLVLESGHAFRATSVEEGSLVIAGDRAYFTGSGTLTSSGSGGLVADSRRFAFLLSAVDGELEKPGEQDRLRLLIWTLKEDGSQGKVVYDSQLNCPLPELDDNAEACQQIDRGSIVIHKRSIRSLGDLFATTAGDLWAEGLQAYPTAFSESTTLSFSTDSDTEYALELYDLKGTLVRKIAAGAARAGQRYEHGLRAEGLAKGLYLARLTTGENVQTVKLVVEK